MSGVLCETATRMDMHCWTVHSSVLKVRCNKHLPITEVYSNYPVTHILIWQIGIKAPQWPCALIDDQLQLCLWWSEPIVPVERVDAVDVWYNCTIGNAHVNTAIWSPLTEQMICKNLLRVRTYWPEQSASYSISSLTTAFEIISTITMSYRHNVRRC